MSRSKYIKLNGIKVWRATIEKCDCGGYHFPHRKYSGFCYFSQYADYHIAKREGLSESEAMSLLSANSIERKFPFS